MGANLKRKIYKGEFKRSIFNCGKLKWCRLTRADLIGADLRDADIRGADFTNSIFLTQVQVNAARGTNIRNYRNYYPVRRIGVRKEYIRTGRD